MVTVHATGPERLYFDSEALPGAQRLARYCDFNAGGATPVETGADFCAVIERWRLDRAVLHVRRLNDVAHEHDPAANASGFDHFMLTLIESGEYEVDWSNGFAVIAPGTLILLDMTRPMRSRARNARLITMSIARELVTTADARELHGLVLAEADAGMLADFLVSLRNRVATLSPAAALAVTQVLAGLLVLALEQRGMGWHAGDLSSGASVRRLIERRLSDPEFGPEKLVVESGLSRATLYRLVDGEGGLGAHIRRRRLDRVRMALADPKDPRPFAAIARSAGFRSESQCSHVFLAEFGVRPGSYRAEAARADSSGGADPRLGHWHSGLR
jgi:AraC-like DNA-binding protein